MGLSVGLSSTLTLMEKAMQFSQATFQAMSGIAIGKHLSVPGARRNKRYGMTRLEITFVLLIMVAIIGGALVMASNTMNQSNSVQETQTVTNLAGAVRKVKMVNGYPADADIGPPLHSLGFIPANITHT